MTLTIGGLFAGAGALDMACAAVFDASHAWMAEHEPATLKAPKPRNAAARILAHRFRDVPNLGDVTAIDWAAHPQVDVMCAGYPCQPESDSGKRLSLSDDRWLWPHYLRAIRAQQPRWAVGENVAGHVGRGLRYVVADLQAAGYAVAWTTIRASDVGACHRRTRVLWLAWPAEHGAPTVPGPWVASLEGAAWMVPDLFGGAPVTWWPAAGAAYAGAAYAGAAYAGAAPGELLPTPRTADAKGPGAHGEGGDDLRTAVSLLPRRQRNLTLSINGNGQGTPLGVAVRQLLPTPKATDGTNGGPNQRGSSGDMALPSAVCDPVAWGRYAAAIARHERVFGRPAPAPTGPYGKGGAQRLCPKFVEWMMVWPDGWVTDVPGITRADAIKACGNGVVIPQITAGLSWLLASAPAVSAGAA